MLGRGTPDRAKISHPLIIVMHSQLLAKSVHPRFDLGVRHPHQGSQQNQKLAAHPMDVVYLPAPLDALVDTERPLGIRRAALQLPYNLLLGQASLGQVDDLIGNGIFIEHRDILADSLYR